MFDLRSSLRVVGIAIAAAFISPFLFHVLLALQHFV
jgi:hypothetical protein